MNCTRVIFKAKYNTSVKIHGMCCFNIRYYGWAWTRSGQNWIDQTRLKIKPGGLGRVTEKSMLESRGVRVKVNQFERERLRGRRVTESKNRRRRLRFEKEDWMVVYTVRARDPCIQKFGTTPPRSVLCIKYIGPGPNPPRSAKTCPDPRAQSPNQWFLDSDQINSSGALSSNHTGSQ